MCLDETRLADLAKANGTDPGALGALMQLATMPSLQACGRYLASAVPIDWSSGIARCVGRGHTGRSARLGAHPSVALRPVWRRLGLALLRCPYCREANHQRLSSLKRG